MYVRKLTDRLIMENLSDNPIHSTSGDYLESFSDCSSISILDEEDYQDTKTFDSTGVSKLGVGVEDNKKEGKVEDLTLLGSRKIGNQEESSISLGCLSLNDQGIFSKISNGNNNLEELESEVDD